MSRYLLLLGSDRDDADVLENAIDRLGELGKVVRLTDVRRLPSDVGDGRLFFNALVELACNLPAGELVTACKRIEHALGRDDDPQDVIIDIDLLATDSGNGWRCDDHALAKGEFARPTVRSLLRQAGVNL